MSVPGYLRVFVGKARLFGSSGLGLIRARSAQIKLHKEKGLSLWRNNGGAGSVARQLLLEDGTSPLEIKLPAPCLRSTCLNSLPQASRLHLCAKFTDKKVTVLVPAW